MYLERIAFQWTGYLSFSGRCKVLRARFESVSVRAGSVST